MTRTSGQVVAGEPAFPEAGLAEDGSLDYGIALFHAGFLVVCNWIVWQASRLPRRVQPDRLAGE